VNQREKAQRLAILEAKQRLLEFGILADERAEAERARASKWTMIASLAGGLGAIMTGSKVAGLVGRRRRRRSRGADNDGAEGDRGGGRSRGAALGGAAVSAATALAPLLVDVLLSRLEKRSRR